MGNSYAGGNDHLTYMSALEAAHFTNKYKLSRQSETMTLSLWEVRYV